VSDFRATADQTVLRSAFGELLDGVMTEARRRTALDGPTFDLDVWHEIAAGGWLELATPEVVIDNPSPASTLALLSEQLGARLVPAPVMLAAALVIPILTRTGTTTLDLDQVLNGRSVVTMVMPNEGSPAAPAWSGIRVLEERGSRLLIGGRVDGVVLGAVADWILIPLARADGTLAVGVLDRRRAGVRTRPASELDFVKPTATVDVEGVWLEPEDLLDGSTGDLGTLVGEWLLRYLITLDSEGIGAAEEVIRRTVAYVSDRRQFGVPVGSFQAVKHILANAYSEMEFARGLAHHVAWRLDHDDEPPLTDLMCSRLLSGEMYSSVVEKCIQCHGGAGFTWEQGLHGWYRQALFHRSHPFPPRELRTHVWAEITSASGATSG
jgi:acyl-CoA dehydrogenase